MNLKGQLSVLHRFSGPADGAEPLGGLARDPGLVVQWYDHQEFFHFLIGGASFYNSLS